MNAQLWPAIADQLERRIRVIEALGRAAPAQSIPVAIDTVRECVEALRLAHETIRAAETAADVLFPGLALSDPPDSIRNQSTP